MTNILFISQFPIEPDKGGVQRVTSTLAKEFIKKRMKVQYLILAHGSQTEIDGVIQYFLPLKNRVLSRENIEFVRKLIIEKEINVIINQAGIYKKSIAFLSAITPDKGVKTYTVHHNCIACLQNSYENIIMSNALYRKILKFLNFKFFWKILKYINKIKYSLYFKNAIKVSNKLVLLSPHFIPELKTFIKSFPSEKIISIPNPVPFSVVENIEYKKENRILFVGRIEVAQKRADLILEIWTKLSSKFPEWEFDVLGDGTFRKELEKRVIEKQISNINFYGFQDPRPFLQRSKIFCMTSAFEGFPMVLVESQAYGVVPFAFNSFSSLTDIIEHEKTGLIIKPYDIKEYIDQLSRLMEDDKSRIKMGQTAYDSLDKFKPELIAEHWKKLFEN